MITLDKKKKHPIVCCVCGKEVGSAVCGRPREYHGPCREFSNHLAALVRLSEKIKPDEQHALLIRRGLFAIVNEFPVTVVMQRDQRGRFAEKVRVW